MAQGELPFLQSIEQISDLLAYLVLYAPSSFLARSGLNLESAFGELVDGVRSCATQFKNPGGVSWVQSQVAAALRAYQAGRVVEGAHILQDIMHAL